jgi:hypothetical protein
MDDARASDHRWPLGRVRDRSLFALGRQHTGFVALLLAGVAARIACMVAYWPGLLYSDSWAYLRLAYGGSPVGYQADRPSGYPLLIRLLTMPSHQVAIVTLTQHLVGLGIGILVYALLLRAGARRALALGAAAVVLLDGDLIVLEQYVMPETFAALALVLSAWFVISGSRATATAQLAASAALLGVAATIRAASLFAVPVWLVYVLHARAPARALVATGAALLAPLLVYGALQSATGHGSALRTADGWFLYGRVAGFADCADHDIPAAARPLCPRGQEVGWSPSHYIWGVSAVRRRFPGGPAGSDQNANGLLGRFALAVIRDQPITYTWTVGKDVGRVFLTDGGTSASDLLRPPSEQTVAKDNAAHGGISRAYLADSAASRVQFPAGLFDSNRYVTTPGWLTTLLLLVSVAAVAWRALGRRRSTRASHTWEIVLLTGSAFASTAGAIATVASDYRYLLVVLPLLVVGGALGLDDLIPE